MEERQAGEAEEKNTATLGGIDHLVDPRSDQGAAMGTDQAEAAEAIISTIGEQKNVATLAQEESTEKIADHSNTDVAAMSIDQAEAVETETTKLEEENAPTLADGSTTSATPNTSDAATSIDQAEAATMTIASITAEPTATPAFQSDITDNGGTTMAIDHAESADENASSRLVPEANDNAAGIDTAMDIDQANEAFTGTFEG
jgi:hypothetical protein